MAHLQQIEFCLSVKKALPAFFTGRIVLDVGSLDVNGNNRYLFENCLYLGVDLFPGNNVDLVCKGHELGLPDESLDVVVSAECFEHDCYYEKTLRNIMRMLKPGGLFFFTCATTGRAEHGTRRSSPLEAPFLGKMGDWGDYYKNLEEGDVREVLDIEALFKDFAFSVNPESHDLYFWGVKKGDFDDRKDYSFRVQSLIDRIDEKKTQALLAGMKNEIVMLKAAVAERETRIAQILHSSPWKLTRLFNMASAFARKIWTLARKAVFLIRHKGIVAFLRHAIEYCKIKNLDPAGMNALIYSRWVRYHDTLSEAELSRLRAEAENLPIRRIISVIMPTHNTNPEWLKEAIGSVLDQTYPFFELCIADDASHDPKTRELLMFFSKADSRIKTVFREKGGHIAEASNSALELVTGDFVALLDHDDRLHPDALRQLALAISQNPEAELLYTDEDKINSAGAREEPLFKPGWSPSLALSQAYLGHLVCLRTVLVRRLGGFRSKCNGSQDYDLWLRASLTARKIVHVPRLLYHWRKHLSSTSHSADSKPYAHEAGRLALNDYLAQRYPGTGITAEDGAHMFTYRPRFTLPPQTKVSIIIPTKDKVDLLRACVDSILHESSWKNLEIIIIDNNSTEPETLAYLREAPQKDSRLRTLQAAMPFNWSRINNIGARAAGGDVLIFLNNDTKVITPDWIEHLAGQALLPDTGAVGGLLLYEDGAIQHSGVVLGMNGSADHVFKNQHPQHTGGGPFISPVLTRNALAVTGACMAITRRKFLELGGFDEAFVICGSDVELCLRAYRHGLYNTLCAEARLFHYESKTRTAFIPPGDFAQSEKKYAPWQTELMDPFYNPNLSLFQTTPTLNLPHHPKS